MTKSLEDCMPLLKEKLSEGSRISVKANGISMEPLIKAGRDTVVLSRTEGEIKKGDILLYEREAGGFIIHRAVKIRKGELFMCGDNQCIYERIKPEAVLARVTEIIRGGKTIDVSENMGYKIYSAFKMAEKALMSKLIQIKKAVIR